MQTGVQVASSAEKPIGRAARRLNTASRVWPPAKSFFLPLLPPLLPHETHHHRRRPAHAGLGASGVGRLRQALSARAESAAQSHQGRAARGRQNGGAPDLLHFIATQIRPRVAQLAPTNPAQQTLWGHSYGALFVLYTLFERPELFSHYIAADPSLWWHNGLMQHYANRARIAPNRHLIIQKSGAGIPQKANPAHTSNVPADAAQQLAAQLNQRGIATEYHSHPHQTHGGLLTQSFQELLGSIK